jgi:transposase-like protein
MNRIAQDGRRQLKELDFSEEGIDRRLAYRLAEIRDDAELFWKELTHRAKGCVKSWVEGMLGKEALVLTGTDEKGEHNDERVTHLSGHYERMLVTTLGTIWDLKVPKVRKKGYRGWKVLDAYEHHRGSIDGLIRGIFLGGVSTRSAGEILKPLLGSEFSAQHVSDVLKTVDGEVKAFHARKIMDSYGYLFFDGLTLKVRYGGRVRKKFVLVAYGISEDGICEIVDFILAQGESQGAWEGFIQDLYRRGLEGVATKLMVTDGGAGLIAALELVYPKIARQRCWAHKLRNVANKCPRKLEKSVVASARRIYQAESRTLALRAFKRFKAVWRAVVPPAVVCLEKDLEELLSFFTQPPEVWKKVRTTNAIERSFREVRRRIRTMTSFTNAASCDRIIYGVINRLNRRWKLRPLPEIAKCT